MKMFCLSQFVLSLCVALPAVSSASDDLPPEVRALMAKERARNFKSIEDKSEAAGNAANNGANSKKSGATIHKKGVVGGCDMQVGNTVARPGALNAKPQPVIITGPVVQVCK